VESRLLSHKPRKSVKDATCAGAQKCKKVTGGG